MDHPRSVHQGPPSWGDIHFIHEALFGYPPDRHTPVDLLMSLPNARHVALALLNSSRFRFECRTEMPLWLNEKWVMTDLHGLNIWVNLHDRFIALTILDGHYEEQLVAEMLRCLPENGVLVDVGANVGVYSLQGARQVGPGGHVFAFEPQPDIFEHLERSVGANGFNDRCDLFRKGLAAHAATGSMVHHLGNPGASNVNLHAVPQEGQLMIELTSLDECDFGDRVDFFKMDVEGFETNVLKGGREFFARYRPPATSEVFPAMLREHGDSSAEEYIALWESYGYRVRLFDYGASERVITAADMKNPADFPPLFNILLDPPCAVEKSTVLVEKIAITPANIDDGRAEPDALLDDPGEVFADSAYCGSHVSGAVRASGGTPRSS